MLYDKRWQYTETKPELKDWQKVLLEAVEVLKIKGWCQHNLIDGQNRVCALGAIDVAVSLLRPGNFHATREIRAEAEKAVQNILYGQGWGTIPSWNDQPGRTAETIIHVFEMAAGVKKDVV